MRGVAPQSPYFAHCQNTSDRARPRTQHDAARSFRAARDQGGLHHAGVRRQVHNTRRIRLRLGVAWGAVGGSTRHAAIPRGGQQDVEKDGAGGGVEEATGEWRAHADRGRGDGEGPHGHDGDDDRWW